MMIVMKYFQSVDDYINCIQVCKNFEEIPDMFRYNPLPYSKAVGRLFPNIQTQYVYSYFDERKEDIDRFTIMHRCLYKEYLQQNTEDEEKIVRYTKVLLERGDQIENGTIPEVITDIGNKCFMGKMIQSIQMNTRVTSLGECNFMDCLHLTEVTLSPYLQHLPQKTFANCKNLRSLTMPKELLSIGEECFYNCSSLTTIELSPWISALERSTFSKCSQLKSIILPTNLKRIEESCFSNCSQLQSIVVPQSVTWIGAFSFHHCSSLERIQLPSNLTILKDD